MQLRDNIFLMRELPQEICMQPSTQEDSFNYNAARGTRRPY